MIAKRITSSGSTKDYKGLAAYILDIAPEQAELDPEQWQRGSSDRAAWTRATNAGTEHVGEAVAAIVKTHAEIEGEAQPKLYHLVASFPEGEQVKRWHLDEIEDRLVDAVGLAGNPRVSSAHRNTDNAHIHVAVSLIDPATGKLAMPRGDYFKLQKACVEIEADYGLTREPHTTSPERHREQRTQEQAKSADTPFLTWARQNAAPDLLKARESGGGWQALHETAARHGLLLKPKHKGMVIVNAGDMRQQAKASSVDAGLSFRVLTEKFGPYREQCYKAAPSTKAVEPASPPAEQKPYAKPKPQGSLWDAFQRDKSVAEKQRAAALAALQPRHLAYARELTEFYRDRLARERLSPTRGVLRRETFDHIMMQRDKDQEARREWERSERKTTKDATPVPNWQNWLEERATAGDVEALKELRNRQQRAARLDADLIATSDPASVEHVIKTQIKPGVRKGGSVVYGMPSSGLVFDEAAHVRVTEPTMAATLLALTLAAERFGSKPLVVRGTEVFQKQVAVLAAEKGLPITFADADLERTRRAAIPQAVQTLNRSGDARDSLHTITRSWRGEGRQR